jgi:O-succinylbenzoic acid--CoA ligase
MSVRAHLRATAGELIAYDLPPGPLWREIVETHAARGASFLPMDHRATAAERRAMLELARPTMVVDDEGETLFADGVPCDPERSWAVVATSGTGGEPKLAALPRTALARAVAGSLEALGIGGSDPWVCCLTPSHVGGLLVLLRGTLGGADVTVLERFEPGRLLDEAPGGAHVSLVPTMLRRLVDLRTDLSGLGVLLVGGGPVDPEVRDRAREQGGRVVETYGMTETCGGVVYDGHPFEGTEVWVDAGAVLVRGPILMDGYRNDPVATGAAFTSDGWLRPETSAPSSTAR